MVLLHHAHGAITDFGGELVGLVHGFIILRVEASTKPGAVQSRSSIANLPWPTLASWAATCIATE